MDTIYKFSFSCAKCSAVNRVTYRVPKTYDIWSEFTCKSCERPLISIMCKYDFHTGIYYKIYDDSRDRYILGENKSVKRDVFWNWVIDHSGERFGD